MGIMKTIAVVCGIFFMLFFGIESYLMGNTIAIVLGHMVIGLVGGLSAVWIATLLIVLVLTVIAGLGIGLFIIFFLVSGFFMIYYVLSAFGIF